MHHTREEKPHDMRIKEMIKQYNFEYHAKADLWKVQM